MAGGKGVTGSDVGLLLLRLALGVIMIAHGVRKVYPGPTEGFQIIEGVQKFSSFVANIGVPYPYPMAWAAVAAEVVGGLLVVVGIFTRLGAFSIAGVMFVGVSMVHWKNGFWIPQSAAQAGPIPVGYEYTLVLLAAALCLTFTGPGKIRLPFGKKG